LGVSGPQTGGSLAAVAKNLRSERSQVLRTCELLLSRAAPRVAPEAERPSAGALGVGTLALPYAHAPGPELEGVPIRSKGRWFEPSRMP